MVKRDDNGCVIKDDDKPPKYLRRNCDGVIVEFPLGLDHDTEILINCLPWWTIGNGSCDCERERIFEEITGESHPSYTGKCLPEGRFDILDESMEVI